jgi:hypothetical protein
MLGASLSTLIPKMSATLLRAVCALTLTLMAVSAHGHDHASGNRSTTSVAPSAARYPATSTSSMSCSRVSRTGDDGGQEDQLGALNLVTPHTRQRALSLARLGRVVALGRPLLSGPNAEGQTPFTLAMTNSGFTTTAGGFASDTITITYHGSLTTHVNSLCPCGLQRADVQWLSRDASVFGQRLHEARRGAPAGPRDERVC